MNNSHKLVFLRMSGMRGALEGVKSEFVLLYSPNSHKLSCFSCASMT